MDPEQEDEIRTAVEEELKFKLEELGSSNATEEAQELLEAAVTKEQEQEKEMSSEQIDRAFEKTDNIAADEVDSFDGDINDFLQE